MCACADRDLLYLFFFNDTATTEIYTLSLHDALPISDGCARTSTATAGGITLTSWSRWRRATRDRKSTRLNSSHTVISYAVFCLKKKKNPPPRTHIRPRQDSTTST